MLAAYSLKSIRQVSVAVLVLFRGGQLQRQLYKIVVGKWVTDHWLLVLFSWFVLAVGLKLSAPSWDSIAADGDLAFLPDTTTHAVGLRALEAAFPGVRSRSQMVIILERESKPLATADVAFALDLARQLHWIVGTSTLDELLDRSPDIHAVHYSNSTSTISQSQEIRQSVTVESAKENLSEAIEIDDELARFAADHQNQPSFQRMADLFRLRSQLYEHLGEPEKASSDAEIHELLKTQNDNIEVQTPPTWADATRDVWTWRNPVVGHKLESSDGHAKLIVLQLGTEFTAVRNIEIINGIDQLIRQSKEKFRGMLSDDLQVNVSGSAAVGGDMLRAAASGAKKTEIVSILLVIGILAVVYRAPFLVLIPMASIALSLNVATSVIALIARDPIDPTSFGIGVFTTTRIFIVVILFGAGTDFCLFLLARIREQFAKGNVDSRKKMLRAIGTSWIAVHDAIVASALTTIVGLAMMWFSDFEKFQFSGPIIAISLAITLVVCLTFTPALLCALGTIAFWPYRFSKSESSTNSITGSQQTDATLPSNGRQKKQTTSKDNRYWNSLAGLVVSRPLICLLITWVVLLVPAVYGVRSLNWVTYDLTDELSDNSSSRKGAVQIERHFASNESSPLTVLVTRGKPFESDEALREAVSSLTAQLYVPGVASIRSLTDPLGDYPPGKRMGLFDPDAWRRRMLQSHRITKERFVSSVSDYAMRVSKLDVVLSDNPFSLAASSTLEAIRETLESEVAKEDSPWAGAQLTMSGTTVGIRDLRLVTQRDQRRIQILVTIGVWVVLVFMLRRVVLTAYLISTVLLSYFATLGITVYLFAYLYGDSYSGIDWKVPLFLFVILVAVGQDYNVYLVTRIFEEQSKYFGKSGVRRAVVLTGGIITSCGLVMAGTFISMASPALLREVGLLWLSLTQVGSEFVSFYFVDVPLLRGITELGFALAFGVLLDTIVVRSILVPSFVVLWQSRNADSSDSSSE